MAVRLICPLGGSPIVSPDWNFHCYTLLLFLVNDKLEIRNPRRCLKSQDLKGMWVDVKLSLFLENQNRSDLLHTEKKPLIFMTACQGPTLYHPRCPIWTTADVISLFLIKQRGLTDSLPYKDYLCIFCGKRNMQPGAESYRTEGNFLTNLLYTKLLLYSGCGPRQHGQAPVVSRNKEGPWVLQTSGHWSVSSWSPKDHLIMMLDFLRRFTKEANIQEMSKAEGFVNLSSFQSGIVEMEIEPIVEMADAEEGGLSSRPSVVQFLLCNYTPSVFISKASYDLCQVCQLLREEEQRFARRLKNALARGGNVSPPEECISHSSMFFNAQSHRYFLTDMRRGHQRHTSYYSTHPVAEWSFTRSGERLQRPIQSS